MNDELRIVVVDDMPDVADSLAMFLQMNGHEVRTAYGGQDALLLVEAWQPHCVLLDLGMPEMSGGELARQLRERYGPSMVLIAVTGDSEVDVALSPEVQHVDHCLRKPLQVEELAKMLPLPMAARGGERELPGNDHRLSGSRRA